MSVSKATILVPFYNRQDYLRETLETVFAQTYKDWKLILIDDGSTDRSIETINDLLSDPRIQIIKNHKNLGKSKSLNRALSLVDTPYILELDSDDWLFPNTLQTLIEEFENQPNDVAIVSGNLQMVVEDRQGRVKRVIERKGKAFSNKIEFLFANQVVWPRFCRTTVLKEIGGWPVDDPYEGRHGIDDLRLLLRLIDRYRFHWIDQCLYKCREHENNLSNIQRNRTAEVREWAIRDALQRWGYKLDPVFHYDEEGWNYLVDLRQT